MKIKRFNENVDMMSDEEREEMYSILLNDYNMSELEELSDEDLLELYDDYLSDGDRLVDDEDIPEYDEDANDYGDLDESVKVRRFNENVDDAPEGDEVREQIIEDLFHVAEYSKRFLNTLSDEDLIQLHKDEIGDGFTDDYDRQEYDEDANKYGDLDECMTISQLESRLCQINERKSVKGFGNFVNEEMKLDVKKRLQDDFMRALEQADKKMTQAQLMKAVVSLYDVELDKIEDEMDELEKEQEDATETRSKAIDKKLQELENKKDVIEQNQNFDANVAGNILIDLIEAKKIKYKTLKKREKFGDEYPYYYVGADEDKKDPDFAKNRKEPLKSVSKKRRVKKVSDVIDDEKEPKTVEVKKRKPAVKKETKPKVKK